MLPLLLKDGLLVPYVVTSLAFLFFSIYLLSALERCTEDELRVGAYHKLLFFLPKMDLPRVIKWKVGEVYLLLLIHPVFQPQVLSMNYGSLTSYFCYQPTVIGCCAKEYFLPFKYELRCSRLIRIFKLFDCMIEKSEICKDISASLSCELKWFSHRVYFKMPPVFQQQYIFPFGSRTSSRHSKFNFLPPKAERRKSDFRLMTWF